MNKEEVINYIKNNVPRGVREKIGFCDSRIDFSNSTRIKYSDIKYIKISDIFYFSIGIIFNAGTIVWIDFKEVEE